MSYSLSPGLNFWRLRTRKESRSQRGDRWAHSECYQTLIRKGRIKEATACVFQCFTFSTTHTYLLIPLHIYGYKVTFWYDKIFWVQKSKNCGLWTHTQLEHPPEMNDTLGDSQIKKKLGEFTPRILALEEWLQKCFWHKKTRGRSPGVWGAAGREAKVNKSKLSSYASKLRVTPLAELFQVYIR